LAWRSRRLELPAAWVEDRLADVKLDPISWSSFRSARLLAKQPRSLSGCLPQAAVEPGRAIAVEDSANGLAVAKRQARVRRGAKLDDLEHDLSAADLIVESLAMMPITGRSTSWRR